MSQTHVSNDPRLCRVLHQQQLCARACRTKCGAAAGIFVRRGNEWLHYTGRPETADVQPYATDHEPAIRWRIAARPVAAVAL